MRIADIKTNGRHRKDLGDIRALADSISTIGLLHPIVVLPDNTLVVGERRVAAARMLGWEEIPHTVADTMDDAVSLLLAERDENTCRKEFAPSEKVYLKRALEAIEKPKAKARQAEHGGTAPGRPAQNTCGKLPQVSGKTRDKVAAAVGMSGRTMEKAEAVVEAAEAEPEKFGPLAARMDKTGKVSGVHKQLKNMQVAAQISAEPAPLPTGPFRVLVIDPPWSYGRSGDPTHRSANPYPSMSIEQMKALPVATISAADCLLWLWTTNAHIWHVPEILSAWGFVAKTILTWEKDRMGTGDWLRGQTEHCVLATKGLPTVRLTNQTTILHGPMREHSRKPEEFYALVEALCPGAKAELFSRTQRDGWTSHGYESKLFSAE